MFWSLLGNVLAFKNLPEANRNDLICKDISISTVQISFENFEGKCSGIIIKSNKVLTSYRCLRKDVKRCWERNTKNLKSCGIFVLNAFDVEQNDGKVKTELEKLNVVKTYVPGVVTKDGTQTDEPADKPVLNDGGLAILIVEKAFKEWQKGVNNLKFYSQPMIDPTKDAVFCVLSSSFYEQNNPFRILHQKKQLERVLSSTECGLTKMKSVLTNEGEVFNPYYSSSFMEMCGYQSSKHPFYFYFGDRGGAVVMSVGTGDSRHTYLLGVISDIKSISKSSATSDHVFDFRTRSHDCYFVPVYTYEIWIKSVLREELKEFTSRAEINAIIEAHFEERRPILTPPSSSYQLSKKQKTLKLFVETIPPPNPTHQSRAYETMENGISYVSLFVGTIKDPIGLECFGPGTYFGSLSCLDDGKMQDWTSLPIIFKHMETGKVEGMKDFSNEFIEKYLKAVAQKKMTNFRTKNIRRSILIYSTPVFSEDKAFRVVFLINQRNAQELNKLMHVEELPINKEPVISKREIQLSNPQKYEIIVLSTTILSALNSWSKLDKEKNQLQFEYIDMPIEVTSPGVQMEQVVDCATNAHQIL